MSRLKADSVQRTYHVIVGISQYRTNLFGTITSLDGLHAWPDGMSCRQCKILRGSLPFRGVLPSLQQPAAHGNSSHWMGQMTARSAMRRFRRLPPSSCAVGMFFTSNVLGTACRRSGPICTWEVELFKLLHVTARQYCWLLVAHKVVP